MWRLDKLIHHKNCLKSYLSFIWFRRVFGNALFFEVSRQLWNDWNEAYVKVSKRILGRKITAGLCQRVKALGQAFVEIFVLLNNLQRAQVSFPLRAAELGLLVGLRWGGRRRSEVTSSHSEESGLLKLCFGHFRWSSRGWGRGWNRRIVLFCAEQGKSKNMKNLFSESNRFVEVEPQQHNSKRNRNNWTWILFT